MASEPERSSDVGKRMSRATTLDIVVTSHLRSNSCWQEPRARSPSHRQYPRLCEARCTVSRSRRPSASPRWHSCRSDSTPSAPPSFPVLLAALVVRYGHGRKECASWLEPAVDALQERRMFGPWDVDDGVEGDRGVEGLGPENHFGHGRFEEDAVWYVCTCQLQLLCRDVDTCYGEPSVGEP